MFKNIGWTLGNACPCNCKHCYSMQVREQGQDLTVEVIDRIIEQLLLLDVETVNFGGNEPIFTNGINPKDSLLPYIINHLNDLNIKVGLTTSGISLVAIEKYFPEILCKINDIDVSIDSPYKDEHNKNRGKNVFNLAIEALNICEKYNIDCSIVMCAMKWNSTEDRVIKLINLAKKHNANIRINMLKPIEKKHMDLMPSNEQIYNIYKILIKDCFTIEMSDPILAGSFDNDKVSGCSCGISSLRINSITADGKIPLSPCVYMHHFQIGDLLKDNILDIISSKEFLVFKERNINYKNIEGCEDCAKLDVCRGGCAASSYWYNYHKTGEKSMYKKDPYCFIERKEEKTQLEFRKNKSLVHQNYLCTWIGKPK